MRTFSVFCALGIVILASSWAAGQTARGNPDAGQAVYEKQCLRCHGSKLDGKGPDSQDLIVRPANLQSGLPHQDRLGVARDHFQRRALQPDA